MLCIGSLNGETENSTATFDRVYAAYGIMFDTEFSPPLYVQQ